MNVYFDCARWKQNLLKQLVEHLERAPKQPAVGHELETSQEVYAFIAGVAACASIVFGRSVTAYEAQACIAGMSKKDYVGGAELVLEGLDDWGVVYATGQPNGVTAYPLVRPVGISVKLRETHNHSLTCPGCDDCPNFHRAPCVTRIQDEDVSKVFAGTDHGDGPSLRCPVCGYDCLHVRSAYARTGVDKNEGGSGYHGVQTQGQTDDRRDALCIGVEGECGHDFNIIFQQHKGSEFIQVEIQDKDLPEYTQKKNVPAGNRGESR
jgi:hypothetical protein